MSKIKLSQIDKIPLSPTPCIELNYGDFRLKVKTRLEDYEEKVFIETITEQAFTDLDYSPTLRQIITDLMFAKLFVVTDEENGIDIPNEIEDLYSAFDVIKKLDLLNKVIINSDEFGNYYNYLQSLIDEQIAFKKHKICACLSQSSANTEAIENVNDLLNGFMRLLSTAEEFLSLNSKKLSRILTPKKIESFMKILQEKGIQTISDKLDKGNEVANFAGQQKLDGDEVEEDELS